MRTTLFVLAALLGACNTLKIDEEIANQLEVNLDEETIMLNQLDADCTPQVAADIKANDFPYNATQQQKDILEWHNKARTDPKSLLPELEAMLPRFGTGAKAKYYSVPGQITMVT